MDKTKTLCKVSLVSIALILLLVSSAALAATENDTGNATIKDNHISSTALANTEESASSKVIETKITTSGFHPAIYGNRIVWEDNRDGDYKYDIYMYDLSTKKETQITTNKSNKQFPAIYGDKIVWEDWRNGWGNDNIYMYDLSTSSESLIDPDSESTSLFEHPAIYGDKIILADAFEEYSQIYMYDLSTKKETQITIDGRAYYPAIYGNRIVWEDDRNRDYKYDLYMYDLSTKKETWITTIGGRVSNPVIYGDRIVWEDQRNGNSDIYMYDLSTKKETQITSSPDDQTNPAIYGNRIVWEDDGGEDDGYTNHGIYMYDISTNHKMKISAKGSAYNPAIYGNNIVWEYNSENGNSDIYMGIISEPKPSLPVAAFSASPTSGKTPLKVTFTDTSTGSPTSWFWNFGDGSKSYLQNPTHKYSKAGIYTVSLTVKNAKGRNTVTKTDYIKVITKPVTAFSALPTSGKTPLNVKFTDTSTGIPTKWIWNFGDGSKSYIQNPIHKYSKAGIYTVSLTVKNAAGRNLVTKTDYIKVITKPIAAFSASPRSGKAPLKVQFTDKSTGVPAAWKWSFGDGTYSTAKNPVHKYSKAGKYTVSLKVKNAKGSNTKTMSGYVVVAKK